MVMNKPYSVSLWDTHPDLDEDTCNTGDDFATLEEARKCIANIDAHFDARYFGSTPYIMLDGPNVHEVIVRQNALSRKEAEDNDSWKREIAMQAGMAGGCEAYNDVMGY